MSASGAIAQGRYEARPRQISAGIKRLALVYLWITVASIAIVISDPAPYDALILGAIFVLPVAGLVVFPRGLALYLLLWTIVIAFGFIASTQAVVIGNPLSHMAITLYLALSSVVIAAFVADRPEAQYAAHHVRLSVLGDDRRDCRADRLFQPGAWRL